MLMDDSLSREDNRNFVTELLSDQQFIYFYTQTLEIATKNLDLELFVCFEMFWFVGQKQRNPADPRLNIFACRCFHPEWEASELFIAISIKRYRRSLLILDRHWNEDYKKNYFEFLES